jgi:hypothetical protein
MAKASAFPLVPKRQLGTVEEAVTPAAMNSSIFNIGESNKSP